MKPKDLDKGIEKYIEFNQLDPKDIKPLGISAIPQTATLQGAMINTKYASKKWEGKVNYYTHDHEPGVKLYTPKGTVSVPERITKCKTLVKLGRLVSIEYKDGDEVLEKKGSSQHELYCTPDGRCLIIIRGKRVIEALIWGGKLTVEARGIVG